MSKKITIPVKYPVVRDPDVLGGLPVIKGTRIPASLVFDLIKDGYHFHTIQNEYPSLTKSKLSAFFALMSKSFNVTEKNLSI
ncbi:hypothetical protein A3C23_00005 [Candidatus Roizmanbacteria bacterium RIFCSPHIGHO2_02_FULL_37_13b]|uniref:Antitoxin n=1 Tax=Candidatus Roizmanbacteria bacterium RIFCSPLOWO2_02_FULL_36_11 TaxID=1802071 RepID=A0A1F7JHI8_9BACT|nr:MAG: hypothetical protein A3C23_00005 [Candidatus Roizmanbacteria bacterium RIFCSPHIGHO2_02_FULL_37_13b]OGK55084.1 MAG: hypothetical protein A3H78_03820 [Candidatus Roizmanbacteria bacterium RIFCSPLOWO2_02_FULL_36_11]